MFEGLTSGATETGSFGNGMQWARYGDGPRTVLWIPAGPGSEVPTGILEVLQARQFAALIEAGYCVWLVTRIRHMPEGHSVCDMAEDYATMISDEFNGHVDAAVGLSYGGMIVQYLAARHPRCARDFVIALSAGTITEWGRDVDYRLAVSKVRGEDRKSAEIMAEYVLPGDAERWQRRMAAPAIASLTPDSDVPHQDLLVEAEAERAFDSRAILPQIEVPVLLITAAQDLFFTEEIVAETAELIQDCTVVSYPNMGHLRASTSPQLAVDIAAYLGR